VSKRKTLLILAVITAIVFGVVERSRLRRAAGRLLNPDIRKQDFAGLERYREANQTLRAQPPVKDAKARVVFIGDSIVEYWNPDAFAERGWINRGITGQTTAQILLRFRQDVVDLQPSIVLIEAGTGDMLLDLDQPVTESNIASMCELAHAHGITVVLISILPVNDSKPGVLTHDAKTELEKIDRLNAWLRTYAADLRIAYIDCGSSLKDGQGKMSTDLSDDGLHPNTRGYSLMTATVEETLERLQSARAVQSPQ
jgi:acyl-CoA thioesterase-1